MSKREGGPEKGLAVSDAAVLEIRQDDVSPKTPPTPRSGDSNVIGIPSRQISQLSDGWEDSSSVSNLSHSPLPQRTHRLSQTSQQSGRPTSVASSPRDEWDHPLHSLSFQNSPQLSQRSWSVGSAGSYKLAGHRKSKAKQAAGVSPNSSKDNVSENKSSPDSKTPVTVTLSSGKKAQLSHVSEDDLKKDMAEKRVKGQQRMKQVSQSESLSTVKEIEEQVPRHLLNFVGQSTDSEDNDMTFYPSLNPMYATVTSNVSKESSDMYLVPDLPGGVLRFVMESDSSQVSPDRFYVCIPQESTVDDVATYMAGAWRRRTPKIVLSVISSAQYFKTWDNDVSVDNFKRGLIQAANLTEMWILTDGMDWGMAKMIGDAAYEEMGRRKCQEAEAQVIKNVYMVEKVTKLTLLAVTNKQQVSYSEVLTGEHVEARELENKGNRPATGVFDLNPNHTHFLLGEEVSMQELTNFRFNLEVRFQLPVGRPRRYRRMPSSQTTLLAGSSEMDLVQNPVPTIEGATTPVIGLMVQGGPPDIDHTLSLLKKRIPVIVLKGFGLASDLIAFAYQEMKEQSHEEYKQTYIKPELMKKVQAAFPKYFKENNIARAECRDKILECVDLAHQDSLTYLTIIDITSEESDLSNLNKYILIALFKAQTRKLGNRWREQIQRDLQLTMDWNRPDLANSEIFKKYSWIKIKVEDHAFHQALIRPGREEFVELFLKKGFLVHRYLHHKRLHNLFENAQDKEFFIGICLEGVLGKSVDPYAPLDREFVETESCELNRLLYRCTRLQKLINPYTLSMNALGSYITDKNVAERRAVNTLVFWAALTNRPRLARVLWRKTEDPMAMALIISMLMHNLAKKWCKESDVKHAVLQTAIEFGKMAVSLLDLSYKDSSNQAFQALNKKLQDFNNKTVVEIARMGKNKWFIAHPCCQKWLSREWYGNLHIRELDWGQPKLPDWFKIYLSCFLVFPMFVWFYFEPKEKGKQQYEKDDDDEEDQEAEDAMLLRPTSMDMNLTRKRSVVKKKLYDLIARGNMGVRLPVWKQIFNLWSAPITKFWINQLFYVFFLVLFSVAVLWPSCGDLYLNVTVFVWTAIIWAELVRGTLVKKSKYPELPIVWKILEIGMIFLFLLMFLVFRILPHFVPYVDYMTTKFIMSIGLLLFYYRTLAVFLPMSPTLGPMLIGINKMVRKDFTTWMRMFLIVMVSGGITIHAVLYPSYPLNQEGVKRALSRAFFAMFLTKIDDLDDGAIRTINTLSRLEKKYIQSRNHLTFLMRCRDIDIIPKGLELLSPVDATAARTILQRDPECAYLYKNSSVGYCASSGVSQESTKKLEHCPYSSLGGYAIVIQYLVITKLVLITLLYAMFSATCSKVKSEAEEIWKYQRYTIIVDFNERLRLPPPLTLISYVCMFLKFVWRNLVLLFRKCRACCKCQPKDPNEGVRSIQIMKVRRTHDFNYWKSCMKVYKKQEEQEKADEERNKQQTDSLNRLSEDMKQQKDNQRKMNDRLVHVERSVTTCAVLLEEMKHMIANLDPKHQILKPASQLLHVSSRQSPYPGTRIHRYPVFDKYVDWEVKYETYDPVYLSKPEEQFSADHSFFVDPDIIELRREEEARQKMSPEELEKLPPLPEFNPMWNTVFVDSVDGVEVEIDRTSWITANNEQLRYKLDKSGLPQNPLGRTGLRGRGKLWRWGPNHRISAVVTRWKRMYSALGQPLECITVEGKKVLEFIVIPRTDTGELTLPGGNVYGKTSAYSVMCEEFMKGVLKEEEVEGSQHFQKDEMIRFFCQFASSYTRTSYFHPEMDAAAKGFSAQVLYRGYIDDPSNTDNAWREAEVWNFHYELSDDFDSKIPEGENVWREVSSYNHLYGNQDSIVKEAARIRDSYY